MMTLDAYQELAGRTEKPLATENERLMHAALGIASEAGEFADGLKRHLIYNKGLDQANLAEELGDLLWYMACAARAMGMSLGDIAHDNIIKLQIRYPERYTDADALARADKRKE